MYIGDLGSNDGFLQRPPEKLQSKHKIGTNNRQGCNVKDIWQTSWHRIW